MSRRITQRVVLEGGGKVTHADELLEGELSGVEVSHLDDGKAEILLIDRDGDSVAVEVDADELFTAASDLQPRAVKLMLKVSAGVLPGVPIDRLTRTWSVATEDIGTDAQQEALGASMVYALRLHDPHEVNWVTHEWIWL